MPACPCRQLTNDRQRWHIFGGVRRCVPAIRGTAGPGSVTLRLFKKQQTIVTHLLVPPNTSRLEGVKNVGLPNSDFVPPSLKSVSQDWAGLGVTGSIKMPKQSLVPRNHKRGGVRRFCVSQGSMFICWSPTLCYFVCDRACIRGINDI